MAWGASRSTDGLIKRMAEDDPSLTSVHIFQGKTFGSKEAQALAKALATNTKLTELYASGHQLENESITAISKALARNSTLKVLCIGNSQFGDTGVQLLLEGLSSNTGLHTLDLECKNVTHQGCKAISQALKDGLAIERLLLARNHLGNEGISSISSGLGNSRVVELDVRDCSISSGGAQDLADAIKSNEKLKVLRLDENNLGVEGAVALAEGIKSSLLEEVSVSGTGISDEGFAALAEACASSNVKIMEANRCGIGPEGAQKLGDIFKSGGQLETLALRENCIGDEGVESINSGLRTGNVLDNLDIGKNQIGKAGYKILLGNIGLRKLNLEAAKLGNEGAILLAQALTGHVPTNLIELELSACEIGVEGMERIFQVLQGFCAPALEVLLVAGNPGALEEKFSMQVDILSTTRTDLDVVWRGSCDEPPLAADGGPPKPLGEPEWAIDQNHLQSQISK